MITPSQKRLQAIVRDSVENEETRLAAWEAGARKEELIQAVDKALREQGSEDSRRLARIAVETIDEMGDT